MLAMLNAAVRWLLVISVSYVLLLSAAEHRSKWVNPHDMMLEEEDWLKPDKSLKMRCAEVTCLEEKRLLEECRKASIHTMFTTDPAVVKSHQSNVEAVFFRQYVKSLLRHLVEHHVLDDSDLRFSVDMMVSGADLQRLRTFSKGDDQNTETTGSVSEIHALVTGMIHTVRVTVQEDILTNWKSSWKVIVEQYLSISIQILCAVALCLVIIYVQNMVIINWLPLMMKTFGCIFLVSIPWTWYHIYLEKLSERSHTAEKGRPADCSPITTFGYCVNVVSSYFHFKQPDDCSLYHQKMMVDAMWEVPPTQALAITITRFLVEPFEHMAASINRCVTALLINLPAQYQVTVLVLVSAAIVLLMIFSFGYQLRLFSVFSIERAPKQSNTHELLQLTKQVERLMDELCETRKTKIGYQPEPSSKLESRALHTKSSSMPVIQPTVECIENLSATQHVCSESGDN